MRLRRIRGTGEKLAKVPYLLKEEQLQDPAGWFDQPAPLFLEVGMGKGGFLYETALRHPENHYLGIDRSDGVMLKAANRNEMPPNIRTGVVLFENLAPLLADGSLDGIFLNFSDPWPKARHAKRRLTHENYLKIYDRLLKTGGVIRLKTDSAELFAFTLEEFARTGRTPDLVTYDLHNDPAFSENVMTEYETRFSQEGKPIFGLVYTRK